MGKELKATLAKWVRRESKEHRTHSWENLVIPDNLDSGVTLVIEVLLAHLDPQDHLDLYSPQTSPENQAILDQRGRMEPKAILAHKVCLVEQASQGSRVRQETKEEQDYLGHVD